MTDDKKNIENTILEERRQKLEQLRDKGDAYSNSFKPKNTAKAIIEAFGEKTKDELVSEKVKNISIAGRIVLKLSLIHI